MLGVVTGSTEMLQIRSHIFCYSKVLKWLCAEFEDVWQPWVLVSAATLALLPAGAQWCQVIVLCVFCCRLHVFIASFISCPSWGLQASRCTWALKQPRRAVSILAFAQSAIFDSTSEAFANTLLLLHAFRRGNKYHVHQTTWGSSHTLTCAAGGLHSGFTVLTLAWLSVWVKQQSCVWIYL